MMYVFIAGLTLAVFALDLAAPPGYGMWVLYLIPLWFTHRSPHLWLLIPLAAIVTVLVGLDLLYSRKGELIDLAVFNRSVGVVVLWTIALLLQHRAQTDDVRHKAYEKIEFRVREQTETLAETSAALRAELIERRHIEDALRTSREQLSAQYEGMPIPAYTWQKKGDDFVLAAYNREAEIITQGRIAQYQGTMLRSMFAHDPSIIADMTRCFTEQPVIARDLTHTLVTTGETKDFSVTYVFVPPDLVVVYTQDISKRKQMEQGLRASHQALRNLVQEREELMQALHDNILQSIYAVGMSLDTCQQLVRNDPAQVAQKLGQAVAGLNDVIRDIRNFVTGPEPRPPKTQQLQNSMANLARTMGAVGSLQFHIDVDPMAAGRLTGKEASHFLLIAREAMSNCLRHSHGTAVNVLLRADHDGVHLTIEDDGIGFETANITESSQGLHNMVSRARRIGAKLEIASKIGQGTRIRLDLPKEGRAASAGPT